MNSNKTLRKCVFLILLSPLIICSCKKIEVKENKIAPLADINTFFNLPQDASPQLKRIADYLKRQNSINGFIGNLAKKEGMPLWDKSFTRLSGNKNSSIINTSSSNDTIVYIPLVIPNTETVNSFLYARLNGTIRLKLFRGREYEKQGFDSLSTTNADRLALHFMMMDYSIFGTKVFKLNDDRLFKDSSSATV